MTTESGVVISSMDLHTAIRDRRVDKVCVAISLLKGRFDGALEAVPRSLLQFIAQTTFRYGVRSIAHLVDTISNKALQNGKLSTQGISLPFGSEQALRDSSFRLHVVDKDEAFGIVNRWNDSCRDKAVVHTKSGLESGWRYRRQPR